MYSQQMDPKSILQVRSFNRIVAERIGALDDRFLQRNRTMNESRLLWEIGFKGEELRTLRERLDIDSGYLTRVLQGLENQGLVKLSASPTDGRVRRANLTRAGLKERHKLDKRSDDLAITILDSLTERQRRLLVSAMGHVENLLQASMVQFNIENPESADARWCFDRYFTELNARFDAGFDPARSISADAPELVPPKGLLLIARLRGDAVGCGALKFHGKRFAEVKRMWVSERMRGFGIGRRLAKELEQYALDRGIRQLKLETNQTLHEAIALYRSVGYCEVKAFNAEPYAHHWFEKKLESSQEKAVRSGRSTRKR
jgi:DNA-binding MarR family transcriptional regulator/GNAT superfamily N-acetyltransferase